MAHLIPNNKTLTYLPPKPIFVMRFRSSMEGAELHKVREDIYKSEMSKEYHIIATHNDIDKDEFEMFNADKIERQEWNELVNQIIK